MEADNGIDARGQLEWLVAAYLVVVIVKRRRIGKRAIRHGESIHIGVGDVMVGKHK